ncbi:MAG: RluA family pseudouridine synthase [Anaerolineae bacterium]|nr:RluA family pseudouridine synthase [Anaerolineae bacterium]
MERRIVLQAERGGVRVDKYVAEAVPDLSRAAVQRLIDEGRILVNGAVVKASYRLEPGDAISVEIPPPVDVSIAPEPIPLDIVYEDADILVVNKPAGMVVHPAFGHASGTLVNAVLAHCPDLAGVGGELRPGIVHRLDKDTSGLIVVAKGDVALRDLQAQFKGREVQKVYLALVEGHVSPPTGLIDAPIGRDPRARKKMAVVPRGGREAQTEYRALEFYDEHTLVEAHPLTGRTHQIRIHMAFIGHPIVGDPVYGFRKQRAKAPRLFLHAARLAFRLPSTGEWREFQTPLPDDLAAVLARLRGGAQ